MSKLQAVADIVAAGKAKLIAGAVQEALDEGNEPSVVLNAMIDAMGVVGEKFKNNEIFVPEMLVAARAMKKGVEVLKPHLASGAAGANGKNLVAMMIESAGFEVIDLGVDVPATAFVEAYQANPDTKIIALSALLTTTMPAMKEAVALLNEQPFRKDIKIMVGGAPITPEFTEQIGADAYTADAASAAQKAKELVA